MKSLKVSCLATFLLTTLIIMESSCNEKFVYKSYQGSTICSAASPIQFPKTVEHLRGIIREAINSKKTVKVIGSLHSVSDMICTTGIPVSLKHMKQDMVINPEQSTVTVGAGAEAKDVLDFLHKHGRTLVHILSYSGVTIGGAIGTGAHGSSLLHPSSISDQVVGVTIIDGLGNSHEIVEPMELKAFRVHLGLLGVIVNVTLKTVPSFKMRIHNYPVDESVLFDGTVLRKARNRDWFQLWWFPHSKGVVFSEGNHTAPETEGNATTNFIPDLNPVDIEMTRQAFEAMQKTNNFPAQHAFEEFTKLSLYENVVVLKPPIFSENDEKGNKKFVNPAVGWTYRLESNRCSNKCAWDNGDDSSIWLADNLMEVKVDDLPQVITRLKQIFEEIPVAFVLIGIMIRFPRKSEYLLAMSADWDTVAIEWTNPRRINPYDDPRSGLGAYQAISEVLLTEFNGRPHWGKNGLEYTRQKAIEKIPAKRLEAFRKIMKKYDPNGLFMNDFGGRILKLHDKVTMPSEVKHCAIEEFCVCRKDNHCADIQFCGKIFKKYNVCRDKLPTVPPTGRGGSGIGYDPLNFTDIVRCFLPEVYSLL